MLATLASPPATCALAPLLLASPMLCHVVYASLLQFGVETALGNPDPTKNRLGGSSYGEMVAEREQRK